MLRLLHDEVTYEDLIAGSTIQVDDEWWEVADIDRRWNIVTLIRTDDDGTPRSVRVYRAKAGEKFPRLGF